MAPILCQRYLLLVTFRTIRTVRSIATICLVEPTLYQFMKNFGKIYTKVVFIVQTASWKLLYYVYIYIYIYIYKIKINKINIIKINEIIIIYKKRTLLTEFRFTD